MSDNKYIKFDEHDEYKETLDRELERFNKGEISKNEFLEKHINRNNVRKSMSLEEYKNLPLTDCKQQFLDAAILENSGIKYLKAELGPYKISDKIPNKREDGTGLGVIISAKLGEFEEHPEVMFTMDMIDVIFDK